VQYHWCGPLCSHHLVLGIFLLLIHSHCAIAKCGKPSLNARFICKQRGVKNRWWLQCYFPMHYFHLIFHIFIIQHKLTLVYIFYICRVLQYFRQSFQQQGCFVVSICNIFRLLKHLIQSCWLNLESFRRFSCINCVRQVIEWKIQNEGYKTVIKKLFLSLNLADLFF